MTNPQVSRHGDHSHRLAPAVTAATLDRDVKLGCSDPRCTARPEEHEEMYLIPNCHPDQKHIVAFYDSVTQEVCFVCPICDRGLFKLGVK